MVGANNVGCTPPGVFGISPDNGGRAMPLLEGASGLVFETDVDAASAT